MPVENSQLYILMYPNRSTSHAASIALGDIGVPDHIGVQCVVLQHCIQLQNKRLPWIKKQSEDLVTAEGHDNKRPLLPSDD